MVKSLLVKVLKKLTRKLEKEASNMEYLTKADSSVLLQGTHIKFTTKKEDRTYVIIGERCLIGATFLFETEKGNITIGNNVHIGGSFFICRTSITVADDVTMAWGITIYDHNSHSIYWEERKDDNDNCYSDYIKYNGNNIVNKDWSNVVSKPIYIGSKVWIGFNVTILKGVTIGEGAVVGACSVITKDVEPWTVVGGNPATVIKRLK
jgi:galactoside O-acetyltransferase